MTTEEILNRLLRHFFVYSGGRVSWRYNEGVSIADVEDKDFEELIKGMIDKREGS